mgnify:CR=1 FL=1
MTNYYIKCSGYKNNISNDLINKLLDIAIETIDYTYDEYNILDYYEDYTEKHPNHSLFYNKQEKEDSYNSHLTKKVSHHSSSHSLTKKSSSRSLEITPTTIMGTALFKKVKLECT